MSEELRVRQRVRITEPNDDGRQVTRTLPGRYRAKVDRDAGTVVVLESNGNEVMSFTDVGDIGTGRNVSFTVEGKTIQLGCGCGG